MLASRPLFALIVAFLAWLALPGTFAFDDHSLFADPAVVPWDAWRQWVKMEQTRPLTYVTFWLDYHLWGANAAGFRFTNLLIHLGAAVFLFLAVKKLCNESVARIAAALFALHPLAHEPLLYVFARGSSLSALFCLLALWRWLEDKPMQATLAFACSLLAKEEWVAFPMAILLIDFARGQRPKWVHIAAMAGLSAAAGARVLYATKVIAGSGSGFGQQTTPWAYFLSQGHAIPGYLWRLAVPVQMSIDPARPPDSLGTAVFAWTVIALTITAVSWFWAKSSQPGFWILPAWLLLLPSSSILPAADAIAYRRMYLPLAILAIALALMVQKYPRVAMGLLLLWSGFAAARRATWQSERALWQEAAELAPVQTRPLIQLARLTPKDEALGYLAKARELAPGDPEVASERGRVWLESGDAAQALSEFGRALALAPANARHLQNRGVALVALGQVDAARADLENALRRDPCLQPARQNLIRLGIQPPPDTCPTTNSAAK